MESNDTGSQVASAFTAREIRTLHGIGRGMRGWFVASMIILYLYCAATLSLLHHRPFLPHLIPIGILLAAMAILARFRRRLLAALPLRRYMLWSLVTFAVLMGFFSAQAVWVWRPGPEESTGFQIGLIGATVGFGWHVWTRWRPIARKIGPRDRLEEILQRSGG